MLGWLSGVFRRAKAICNSERILETTLLETGARLDYRAGLGLKDYAIHVKHMIYRHSNPHGKQYEGLKKLTALISSSR